MRSRRRWSDTERRWGPFTYDRKQHRTNHWTILLDSGEEEYPGCTLRLQAFTHTLIIDLPPILRPYREKVQARFWDAETIARMGRDWYYDEDRRQVGFSIYEGFLNVRFGRQSDDSRTERRWGYFFPWTQWRHVARRWYGIDGEPASAIDTTGSVPYEREAAHTSLCPKVRFTFRDFDGEELVATTHIEEREWRLGTGAWRWLSWFRRPQVQRYLHLEFSGEIGRKKGSWKGGTLAHSIELKAGEAHRAGFVRYCAQRELTLLTETPDRPDPVLALLR